MKLYPDIHHAHEASAVPEDRPRLSVETPPPIEPERLFGGHPILEPIVEHRWESHVVLNPAAVLVEAGPVLDGIFDAWEVGSGVREQLTKEGGACVMLYRAQGEQEPEHRVAPSSLGLALFTPEMELAWRLDRPVLSPVRAHHNLGLEDPRCTRIGDSFYVYYTGYTDLDPEDVSKRRVSICLARTTDFKTWEDLGMVGGDVNVLNNKNATLLPEPVEERWLLLHRPMAGEDLMRVHLATARAPEGPWFSEGLFMDCYGYREFTRTWLGAGGPPISLGGDRFLMIYHVGHFTEDGSREYNLAAALLDFSHDEPVRSRIEPLMRPVGAQEQVGEEALGVDNVLFTCANHVWGDHVYIPYGGADSRIFAARLPLAELVEALEAAEHTADYNGLTLTR